MAKTFFAHKNFPLQFTDIMLVLQRKKYPIFCVLCDENAKKTDIRKGAKTISLHCIWKIHTEVNLKNEFSVRQCL